MSIDIAVPDRMVEIPFADLPKAVSFLTMDWVVTSVLADGEELLLRPIPVLLFGPLEDLLLSDGDVSQWKWAEVTPYDLDLWRSRHWVPVALGDPRHCLIAGDGRYAFICEHAVVKLERLIEPSST